MTEPELVALAVKMRAAQNEFYRNGRTSSQLARARELEKRFDRAVEERSGRQGSLFETGKGGG